MQADGRKSTAHPGRPTDGSPDRPFRNPLKIVDVEQASRKPAPLKLSQIASEIEYYTVGDARFTVTQAIELPDSNAFITFTTRASTTGNKVFRANGMASRHWLINGTTR